MRKMKKTGMNKKLKKSFEYVKNLTHFNGVNLKRIKTDFTMAEQMIKTNLQRFKKNQTCLELSKISFHKFK